MRKLLLTAIIPITLVAGACRTGQTLWAACEPTNNPWGTDGTWVLVCQNGEWKPTMLVTEYVQLLQGKTVNPFAPLPTKPTTTTTTAAPTTTTSTTTTTAPVQAPDLVSLDRPAGSTTDNQQIILTGTGFTGTTAVTFGGTAVNSFTVDSPTQITATLPDRSAGVVNVVVTNPGGSDTLTNGFEFIGNPTITNIAPDNGPAAGGTVIVITGTNFAGSQVQDVPEVNFEAAGGTVTLDSPTQLTVTTPPGAVGGASVTVNTWAGTSAPGLFTYNI